MPTLYAHANARRVQLNRSQAIVTDAQDRPLSIAPMDRMEALSLASGVELNSSAIVKLVASGKTVSFLDGMDRWVGSVTGASDHGISARIDQVRAHLDPAHRLRIAKFQVCQKLRAQTAHLRFRHIAIAQRFPLVAYEKSVEAADSLDQLRGTEGGSARRYFELWFAGMPQEFRPSRRSRRPPRDPMNALMSYGYALLAETVFQAVADRGLDPYVGFLHDSHHALPALVMDLMEPFRATLTDRWVSRIVGLNMVHIEDFESSTDGTRILPGIKPVLLKQWREVLASSPLTSSRGNSRTGAKAIRSSIETLVALTRSPC